MDGGWGDGFDLGGACCVMGGLWLCGFAVGGEGGWSDEEECGVVVGEFTECCIHRVEWLSPFE